MIFNIKNKFFIIIASSFLIASLGWFFVGGGSLIPNYSNSLENRGFPLHFYEGNYKNNNGDLVQQKFLVYLFLGDILFYFFIISAVWYLFGLGFKKHQWRPLIISVVLGLIFLYSSLSGSSCVTGFPIEFFLKCSGESNITFAFTLFGWIFDTIFWFSLSSMLVAVLCVIYNFSYIKDFFIYKDVWFTFLGAWITLALVSVLGSIADMFTELGVGILVCFALLPFLIKSYKYYRKNHVKGGKVFFFSVIGYIVFGIAIGWTILSIIFNLSYEGGFFDFTDFGFVLSSFPLMMFVTKFTNFEFNNDRVLSRLILYLISFINLAIIIFILDCFGAFFILLYMGIKSLFKK